MQAKTERFEMRLDQDALDKVDEWRAKQRDLPSRAEAVRRLIEVGLSSEQTVYLSDADRLIVSMLCDIYRNLNITNGVDPKFVERAIFGGHYWGLNWQYPGIFHGHMDKLSVRDLVLDILDMWDFIELSYEKLSRKDKQRVVKEVPPFGKNVRFPGFDGNRESEYLGIAHFLVNDMGRFTTFTGRDLNSHTPMVESYRRMLPVFEPIRRTPRVASMGASKIIEFLKLMIGPDNS